MQCSVAKQSFQGGREYNEDRVAVLSRQNASILILADGLGGHKGGGLAAQTFVDALSTSFDTASMTQLRDSETFLSLSIAYAHRMIHLRAKEGGYEVDSPKTTCVVCLIIDGVARWAHAGDSRLYHIRNNDIIAQTKDHVARRPSGPINRCVGGAELPRPDVSDNHELKKGDTLLLASDGAWHSLKTQDIKEYVDPQHPQLGLDTLLLNLESRNKPPSDNLSMILLFWGEKASIGNAVSGQSTQTHKNARFIEEHGANNAKESIFNMEELDQTINEIESFISELDDTL